MLELTILMLERSGLIVILAFVLMTMPYLKNLMNHRKEKKTIILLIVIFGFFAIISNFTGVEINNNLLILDKPMHGLSANSSLANTRVLTIGVSGLVGGPIVGIAVGLVSGVTRFFQGGESGITYVVSSLLIGSLSGLYGLRTLKVDRFPKVSQGMMIGALMEIVQMVCIVTFSSSLAKGLSLVEFIIIPMTLANSIGTAVFLYIIKSSREEEERTKAVQTQDVLNLANETLPLFRTGLTETSCTEAAEAIKELIKVSAVSITNQERILAFVGEGSDHHQPSSEILTDLSKQVLREGKIKEVKTAAEIGCHHPACRLTGAIVIPLIINQQVVGILKLYFTDTTKITFVERQLAEGLGRIFASQIELGQIEIQNMLRQDAEIKALHSQVNPHFLFNTLNTLSALIRVDSEAARKLLLEFSHFFRYNIEGSRGQLLPLHHELRYVEAYVKLEQARFPNKYQVLQDVQPEALDSLLPPFIIQVLVENAFKHAFGSRIKDNQIIVSVAVSEEKLSIKVTDNGQGIPSQRLVLLGQEQVSSISGTGSALDNLNKRLKGLFGEGAGLKFVSSEKGTEVSCVVPAIKEEIK
ncbi:sensor histidine kinase [Vagococcus salmoninarum]|uniref:sensor histidine kinase n=1 Tax=Vagococcus salmoninarum TaxID=2739 RepID=UPI0018822B16|nr:sensor histidine kinase [Vagococcus salmoninarum]MBE9388941.1 sensor histidine kinase [Vagococcus salmoninarum]